MRDELIRNALDQIHQSFTCVLDATLRFQYATGNALDAVGLNTDILQGKSAQDANHGLLPPEAEPLLRRALTGHALAFQHVLDNRRFNIQLSPLQSKTGSIEGVLVHAEESAKPGHQDIFPVWESMSDGFYALDTAWNFTYINAPAERVLQRQRADLLGHNIWAEFQTARESRLFEQYHHAVETQTAVHFEYHHEPLRLWVEVNAYPSPAGLAVYFHDISERKAAEKALQRSEARHARAQAIAHLGYLEMDIATGKHIWSEETYRILGQEPHLLEPSLENLLKLVHPEDQELAVQSARALFHNHQSFEIEHRIVRPDGEIRWVRTQAEAVPNGGPHPARILCTLLDITEWKLAVDANRQLATIVESSHDAITSVSLDGVFTSWNSGAEQIYGYSREEALGQSVDRLLPPERAHEVAAIHARLRRGEFVEPYETKRIRKDGRVIDVAVTTSPILNAAGEMVGASCIARDITAQKLAEADRERFFTLSLDLLASCDVNGTFLRANPAFENILGYAPGSLIGRSFFDIMHPEDRKMAETALKELTEGQSVVNVVSRHLCSDGTYKTILWASAPYENIVYGSGRDITELQAAEQARAQSLALLRATLESTADGIAVVSREGFVTHYNQRFLEMWHVPPEILETGNCDEIVNALKVDLENPEEFDHTVHEVAANPGIEGFDVLRFKDGRVYERYTKTQWLGEENVGRVWNFRDITASVRAAREQAELNAALEHQHRRLDEILDNVPGIVWENDINPETLEQRVVYVSKHIEDMLGYTRQELLDTPDLGMQMVHPDDLERFTREHTDLLHHDDLAVMRYKLVTRDGRVIWSESYCTVMRNEKHAAIGVRGVTMDITHRMHAEAEQSRLTALLESTTDLVAWTDRNGNAEYINPAGRQMMGLLPNEPVAGRPLTEFVPGWAAEVLQNTALPYATQHSSWSGELALLRRDGKEIPISQVINAHKDAAGKVLFYSGIARDISESKRVQTILERANEELEERVHARTAELAETNRELQSEIVERQMAVGALREVVGKLDQARQEAESAREEAERANSAKSEFLSRMSHELRTPLNAILGFGQILEMRQLPAKEARSIHEIVKAGRHLLQLINEVLEISRIEAGKLALTLEPIELHLLFRETLSQVEPLAAQRGISLINEAAVDAPASTRYVLADRQRLHQVLLNLLSNAIKYNREGGRVHLSIKQVRNTVALTPTLQILVIDTGPGIDPADHEKIFVPFERIGAEKTRIEGTGIGLSLAKRLVELMDGQIGVDSELGQGSIFWVELPSTPEPPGFEPPHELEANYTGPLALSSKRQAILYIEDNASNLSLLESVFEEMPHIKLLTAIQGSIGLELARLHQPDVILLDVHLPDIQGDEVLRQLIADPTTANIPVVVISADATATQIDNLLNLGARHYLTKPLDIPNFTRVLRELLSQPR